MKLPKGYTVFDAAEYLKTEDEIGYFLDAAFAEGGDDQEYIAHVLSIVARARGMAKVAKKAKLSKATLAGFFSKTGNHEFESMLKIISALGLKLKVA